MKFQNFSSEKKLSKSINYKDNPSNIVFDKNEKIHKRSIKKIDAIVTGMLLGWVVASIYGIKKTYKHADETKNQEWGVKEKKIGKIIKMLIFGFNTPIVEKKKGFFSRLFKK